MIEVLLEITLPIVAFLVLWVVFAPGRWTCDIVGHKPREEDYTGGEYMEVVPGAIDGIGREHATLYAKCQRCEARYRAGQIHLPQRRADKVFRDEMAKIRAALDGNYL